MSHFFDSYINGFFFDKKYNKKTSGSNKTDEKEEKKYDVFKTEMKKCMDSYKNNPQEIEKIKKRIKEIYKSPAFNYSKALIELIKKEKCSINFFSFLIKNFSALKNYIGGQNIIMLLNNGYCVAIDPNDSQEEQDKCIGQIINKKNKSFLLTAKVHGSRMYYKDNFFEAEEKLFQTEYGTQIVLPNIPKGVLAGKYGSRKRANKNAEIVKRIYDKYKSECSQTDFLSQVLKGKKLFLVSGNSYGNLQSVPLAVNLCKRGVDIDCIDIGEVFRDFFVLPDYKYLAKCFDELNENELKRIKSINILKNDEQFLHSKKYALRLAELLQKKFNKDKVKFVELDKNGETLETNIKRNETDEDDLTIIRNNSSMYKQPDFFYFKYNKDKDDFLKPINDNRALNSVDKVGVKMKQDGSVYVGYFMKSNGYYSRFEEDEPYGYIIDKNGKKRKGHRSKLLSAMVDKSAPSEEDIVNYCVEDRERSGSYDDSNENLFRKNSNFHYMIHKEEEEEDINKNTSQKKLKEEEEENEEGNEIIKSVNLQDSSKEEEENEEGNEIIKSVNLQDSSKEEEENEKDIKTMEPLNLQYNSLMAKSMIINQTSGLETNVFKDKFNSSIMQRNLNEHKMCKGNSNNMQ